MSSGLRLVCAVALALGASACGGSDVEPSGQPERAAGAPRESEPGPAVPKPAPAPEAPAQPMQEQVSGTTLPEGDAAEGGALYQTYCASCHGPRGEGDGPVAAGLNPKPAKHSDGAYMNTLSNEHLFKVIKEGGVSVGKSPLMAPWGGTLGDEQIADLVAFVRSLAKPPYPGS
jgi:mono/diheme cytochrome c family protein